MEKAQKRRIRTDIVVILLILVGLPLLFLWRTVQHFRRNEDLVHAVKRNDTKVAIRLLDAGADANALDETGRTGTLLQRLIEDMRANHIAQYVRPDPVLYMMLAPCYSQSLKKRVPTYPENPALVRALLDHGADSNTRDSLHTTVLMLAGLDGYNATVRLLLEHGANPLAQNGAHSTPIMFATGPCVETLIEHGANPQQAVMPTAGRGDVIGLQTLLRHGVDVNATDKYGYTPLILAAGGTDSAETVRLLLAHGAKIEAREKESWTPLLRAAWEGHFEVMKALLEHGADVNAQTDKGWGALLIVQRQFPAPYTRLLLSRGAHIDAQAKDGDTPLLNAVAAENEAGVEALLAAGADYKIKNKSGDTALALALQGKQTRIAELLRKAGAQK